MGDFIHYANPRPSRARRALTRALIPLALLTALAIAARHRNEILVWLQTYPRQHRALIYQLPPNTLVFNNNPASPAPTPTSLGAIDREWCASYIGRVSPPINLLFL